MAVSAFRSATRRGGQFGSEEADPSNPRSRRDSSTGRSSHRRSSSITDFSPKYLSDCSSSYRSYSKTGGRRGGRSSVCPSDSENDMDYVPMHGRHQYRNADSEDEKPLSSPVFITKVNHQRGGFKRTSRSVDLIQNRPNILTPNNDLRGDDTQDFAEEKTIGAVYAQMKSLRAAPPVGDSGSSDFLDALRSEIRRAVGEIRVELEESKRKNCKSLDTSDEGRPVESQGTDVIQAVADIRKEYSTKFEQSEKRVRELWSQLAIEEQRCSELAKIVKELLPTAPSSTPQSFTSSDLANRKRSHKRRNSAEKQIVSTSLENEAQKYFEDCVSISPMNYQGDSDGSSLDVVQYCESTEDGSLKQICSGGKTLSKEVDNVIKKDITSIFQEDEPSNSPIVGSDGVALPWLRWEAEAVGSDTDIKMLGNRRLSAQSSSNSSGMFNIARSGSKNPFHTKLKGSKTPAFDSKGGIVPGHVKQSSSISKVNSCGGYDELVFKKSQKNSGIVSKSSMPSIFTIDDKLVPKDYDYPDVDTLMSERIRYRSRVERGELLLCQGFLL